MISFTVSMPPSANNLFANKAGGGRHKTKAYEAWISENEWLVKMATQDGRKIAGPYSLTIRIGKPDNRKRDIANCEKALSDLLVSVGAVRDDSDCQRCLIEWSEDVDGAFVLVVPTQPVPVRKKARA